jgi:hypothetical protein
MTARLFLPEDGMRRVLIINYHFLPVHNVAVKRLVGYARQLPAFGWQPVVLTREWLGIEGEDTSWGLSWEPEIEKGAGFPIHHVAAPPRTYRGVRWRGFPWPLRKVVSLCHLMFGDYPDQFVSWARPAVDAAVDLARRSRIDAVMSYCPPETNHVVGQRVARALDVPWVPFFGDMWGFFLARLPGFSPGALIRKAYHHWWLAPAAACAAVSPYMVNYLARTYRKPVELVLTGFDPSEFAGPSGHQKTRPKRLIVSHVGSLYPGDQKPEIFFDGLDRLLRLHPDVASQIEVRFVGSKCENLLRGLVQGRPCQRVCAIQPKVDSRTAVSLVKESDILLVFNCSADRARHGTMSYPTKIFEGLGARRPILAVPSDGDWVDELLARTDAGRIARDAEEVAGVLWDWYSCWAREGVVPYRGRSEEIEAFSLQRQAARLSALLCSAVDSGGSRRP